MIAELCVCMYVYTQRGDIELKDTCNALLEILHTNSPSNPSSPSSPSSPNNPNNTQPIRDPAANNPNNPNHPNNIQLSHTKTRASSPNNPNNPNNTNNPYTARSNSPNNSNNPNNPNNPPSVSTTQQSRSNHPHNPEFFVSPNNLHNFNNLIKYLFKSCCGSSGHLSPTLGSTHISCMNIISNNTHTSNNPINLCTDIQVYPFSFQWDRKKTIEITPYRY